MTYRHPYYQPPNYHRNSYVKTADVMAYHPHMDIVDFNYEIYDDAHMRNNMHHVLTGNRQKWEYNTWEPLNNSNHGIFRKENLRSRQYSRDNHQCLSGVGCGLGNIWIDPRFDPGPQSMYPGDDASYAHGGHAGGPTYGSFIPSAFQTANGSWDHGYIRGIPHKGD